MRNIALFSGNSHPALSQRIARLLGLDLADVVLEKFSNKETHVEIKRSVRGVDVYLIQSGCGSINDMLMELFIMVDGCRRASAKRIVVVIPCFPYAKQPDLPYPGKDSFSAMPGTLIANLLQEAGVDHIITMDLHDSQFQGFFDIPVDNLYSQPLMINYIRQNSTNFSNAIIVSPDAGGAKRAASIAAKLGMEFALIHKGRQLLNDDGELMLVGDVKDKVAILIDDIIDTAHTTVQAAKILIDQGANRIVALITHGIMSGDAIDLINTSLIDEVIVSNTVPQELHVGLSPKIKVFDVAPLFAEAIRRIHNGESVSYLFSYMNEDQ